jgi:hypothetical protein
MSEREILKLLQEGELQFPPLCLSPQSIEQSLTSRLKLDAFLRITWDGHSHDFAVECKALSTPQALRDAVSQIQSYARIMDNQIREKVEEPNSEKRVYSMVVVPYLSEEQIRQLEAMAVSGLDLCGNGIIIVPGEWLVVRTGAPNKFPHTAPIKNIYTGVSSLVARAFLIQPKYTTVGAIKQKIEQRGRYFAFIINQLVQYDEKKLLMQYNENGSLKGLEIAFSTVSKALKGLEEDLIIEREKGMVRLIQPEKLLEKLAQNYKPPKIKRRFTGKLPSERAVALTKLLENAEPGTPPPILTGAGAAGFYSSGARGKTYSLYCTDIERTLADTHIEETKHFPDLELLETEEPTVYFDRRNFSFAFLEDGAGGLGIVASPIQTYLELMRGDARDKQMARQVWLEILQEMEKNSDDPV